MESTSTITTITTTNPHPPRRGRRPTLACEPCRRKKIRCDRTMPCEQCSRSKSECCNYLVHPNNRPANNIKHSRSQKDSNEAKGRVTQAESTIPKGSNCSISHDRASSSASSRKNSRSGSTSRDSSSSLCRTFSFSTPLSPGSEHHNPVDRPSPSFGLPLEDNQPFDTESLLLFSFVDEENWTARGIFVGNQFLGPSHWMNSIHQFREVRAVLQRVGQDDTCEERHAYEKCKALARRIKTRETMQLPSQPNLQECVPPQEVTLQLVQAYLRTFESVFCILHVPSFLRELQDYCTNPAVASHDFILQLYLVMAIGQGFCPDVATICNASTWIFTAQTWLSSVNETGPITLRSIQSMCLLLVARQMYNVGSDLVWISAGTLLTTAMQIGLHISPSRLSKLSFFEQEIRRRLWATVVELTLQSTMDLGSSPLISSTEIDCEPPTNIPDEDFDRDTIVSPTPKPLDQFTRASILINLVKSLPVRLEIARTVNDFRSECPYQETIRLSGKLSTFCKENMVQYHQSGLIQKHSFSINLLDLYTHRFLLALHHPFASKARMDPSLYFSRKVRLEVALSVLTRTSVSEDRDYARVLEMSFGLFRAVPSQAASVVCEELMSQLDEGTILSCNPLSSSDTHNDLHKLLEDYIQLLASGVARGSMNVEGHMLFSSLLGQIDALKSGSPVELGITSRLKKSLDECHKTIETRVQLLSLDDINDFVMEDLPLASAISEMDQWLQSEEMVDSTALDFESWLPPDMIPASNVIKTNMI